MLYFNTRPKVLAIGAHPDDIELGSGGFIHRLVTELAAEVTFLVFTPGVRSWQTPSPYDRTDRRKEAREAAQALQAKDIFILDFPDCELHTKVHELIRTIEGFLYENGKSRYDLVLTHSKADTHSDHREVHEATISAARYYQGTIFLYQAPSTIPNEFRPTFFVSLDQETIERKIQVLMAHKSQQKKGREYMRDEQVRGMAATWALFHRTPEERMEAFEVYKSFWQRSNDTGPKP